MKSKSPWDRVIERLKESLIYQDYHDQTCYNNGIYRAIKLVKQYRPKSKKVRRKPNEK